MPSYLAKIVFRIICADGDHMPQFDEQLRLIFAEDRLAAFHKARKLGHREEDQFLNEIQKPVRWQFIDVTDLYHIDESMEGTEVFSRIFESEQPGNYLKWVRTQASGLLEDSLNETSYLM